MISLVSFKLGSAALLLVVTVLGALAPLYLRVSNNPTVAKVRESILNHSSFFTGGVFMGAGLLHMLPDAVHDLTTNESINKSISQSHFPIVYGVAGLGFLLIWGLDKLNFSHRQLDNPALLSVASAAQSTGGSICFVSTRPVYSYGTFKQNQAAILKQAREQAEDTLKQRAEEQGLPDPDNVEHWVESEVITSPVRSPDVDHSNDQSVDGNTAVNVYPITIIHVQEPDESEQNHRSPDHYHSSPRKHDSNKSNRKSKQNNIKSPDLSSTTKSFNKQAKKSSNGKSSTNRSDDHSISMSEHGHAHNSSNGHQNRFELTRVESHEPLLREVSETCNDDYIHEHEQLNHTHVDIPSHAMLPIFLAFIFSIHSAIEGVALGAQREVGGAAISLLIAIGSHKLLEAISVGANFMKEKVAMKTSLPVLAIYSLMTPMGIMGGVVVDWFVGSGSGENGTAVLVQALLQAFAAGSFLYLAVHEITDDASCSEVARKWQVILFAVGFGLMTLLAIWT